MAATIIRDLISGYESRDLGIAELIAALSREVIQRPDHRQSVVAELTAAFQAGDVSANDLALIMKGLPEGGHTSIATVADISIDHADAQATMHAESLDVDIAQTALAAAANSRTRNASPRTSNARATVAAAEQPRKKTPGPGRTLAPGDVLNERFELEEAVGEGGMGIVFRAKDRLKVEAQDREPYVALKVLSEAFSSHPDSLLALQREARNAQRLAHPNIVRCYDFARDPNGDHYYMVMEFLRGEPLDDYLKKADKGGLPPDQVWSIIKASGSALAHAHEHGIIHCDVKPSNILFTENGGVKVLDFGIARAMNPDTLTKWHGLEAVSPRYASQERLKREQPDPRDDLFGLACVAYELLTHKHPFERIDAIKAEQEGLKPARPPGLKRHQWRALSHALEFHREDRLGSIDEFLDAFDPARAKQDKSKWLARILPSVVLAAIFAIGAYLVLQWRTSPDESYIKDLLSISLKHTLTPDQIKRMMMEGNEFAQWGREDFETGEHHLANAQLKNGASTAMRPLYTVLTGTNDAGKRRAAALGIIRVEQIYVEAINKLVVERKPRKALWLACQGLAIPPGMELPYWHETLTAYRTLWSDIKGGQAPSPNLGCVASEVPDEWGEAHNLRSPLR